MSKRSTPHSQPYTRAERIQDLLTIDSDVANILRAASIALSDLTPSSTIDSPAPSLEVVKASFETHTLTFYNQIQSVSARLRRQVYALEEAGIIAAEPEVQNVATVPQLQQQSLPGRALGPSGALAGQNNVEPAMPITNGGLGNLDVGWLNSRRDVVGKMKEAELWKEARVLVESLEGSNHSNGHDREDHMDVDDHCLKGGNDDNEIDSS